MANIHTFTAAFKRDGQEVRNIPGCTTHEGYLCKVSGSKLAPLWDSAAIQRDGIAKETVTSIPTIQAAIAAGMEKYLIRFGKHDGYWVWNLEAAERKKLEAGKTLFLYEKKQDDWDDDAPELRMSDKPYPKEVWAAITPHIRKGRRGYEITNHSGIKAALAAIGWKTNL